MNVSSALLSLILTWAPTVHDLIIDIAFKNESLACLASIKKGSREMDQLVYQSTPFAYLHGMRSSAEQTDEEVLGMLQAFVIQTYSLVEKLPRSDLQRCHLRGRALHPIMDMTSPAHRNPHANLSGKLEVWHPLKHPSQIFEHGDWASSLSQCLPLPFSEFIPESKEDANFIDDHPEYLRQAAELIRELDDALN